MLFKFELKMAILKNNITNIQRVADEVKNGGLVAFPTETVYGLGANGLDPLAIAKIFEAKQRPSFNPLIIHINSLEQLDELAVIKNKITHKIINSFWPGPLTIVLPKKEIVPNIVTAGNSTVALRMPAHPLALELIQRAGCPIAAPSANLFGRLSPTTAQHVEDQLGRQVDLILDGGNCEVGLESTIVQVIDEEVYLLRPGGLITEEIENVIGKELRRKKRIEDNPNAPGQLKSHYAPSIPIDFISDELLSKLNGKKVAAMFLEENKYQFPFEDVKILAPNGNFREAAVNLFAFLHDFEKKSYDYIVCESVAEIGLGKAIMDRLRKATNHYSDYDILR